MSAPLRLPHDPAILLTPANYQEWHSTIVDSLAAAGADDAITESAHLDTALAPKRSQVCGWINLRISESLKHLVATPRAALNPHEMLDILAAKYGTHTAASQLAAITSLINATMEDEEDVTAFTTRVYSYLYQLTRALPTNISPEEILERFAASALLHGVSDRFPVEVATLRQRPSIDQAVILSALQSAETERNVHEVKFARAAAVMAHRGGGKFNASSGSIKTCAHCKKSGHEDSNCWVLHPEKKKEYELKKSAKRSLSRNKREKAKKVTDDSEIESAGSDALEQ